MKRLPLLLLAVAVGLLALAGLLAAAARSEPETHTKERPGPPIRITEQTGPAHHEYTKVLQNPTSQEMTFRVSLLYNQTVTKGEGDGGTSIRVVLYRDGQKTDHGLKWDIVAYTGTDWFREKVEGTFVVPAGQSATATWNVDFEPLPYYKGTPVPWVITFDPMSIEVSASQPEWSVPLLAGAIGSATLAMGAAGLAWWLGRR